MVGVGVMKPPGWRLIPVLAAVATGLVAAGLAGCSALPVGQPVPVADMTAALRGCERGPLLPEYSFAVPSGLPPATRAVIAQALAEWRSWGGQIVDFRAVDAVRSQAVRRLSGDDAAGPYPVLAVVGCWENDLRLFSRVKAYWQPLFGDAAPTERARERLEGDFRDGALAVSAGRPASWTIPWSAAFISYVVTTASREHAAAGSFVYGEAHDAYTGAVLAETGQRYVARQAARFTPRAGDIVCSYRAQAARPPWTAEATDWRLGAAHCDIVVAVDKSGREGRLLAIGGNLMQSVSLSVHATDAGGRLVDGIFRNWAIVLADRANPAGL
jgi:hypothetical protein